LTSVYRTQATAIGGRRGAVASADGVLRLTLAIPRELGGRGSKGTNPEQLFAAGYAACFLATLKLVAETRQCLVTEDASVTATVALGLGRDENGLTVDMDLDVALDVDLPGFSEEEARALAHQAHELCPYSKAVKGNIEVRITIQ